MSRKAYRPPPCPECGAWSNVIETRRHKDGTIKRRLECANLHRFTRHEKVTQEGKNNAE